jgi:aspartate/tyrosine/aromatic aminotransferase
MEGGTAGVETSIRKGMIENESLQQAALVSKSYSNPHGLFNERNRVGLIIEEDEDRPPTTDLNSQINDIIRRKRASPNKKRNGKIH